jgi:hypothetical protein
MTRLTKDREEWRAVVGAVVIDWAEWLRRFGAPCICGKTKAVVGQPVECGECRRFVPDRRVGDRPWDGQDRRQG